MFGFQYSQKEDKYEEEIRVLTEKLKEVSHISVFVFMLAGLSVFYMCCPAVVCVPG